MNTNHLNNVPNKKNRMLLNLVFISALVDKRKYLEPINLLIEMKICGDFC